MITIGVCGPIDLKLLNWNIPANSLPATNSFPLTSYYINALLKRGYKVIAYTNSTSITEPTVIESGNLKVCISREKSQPGRRFFKFEIEDLKALIQAHPAEAISAFWTYEYALAAIGSGIPTAIGIHDVAWKILVKQFDPFRFVRWLMNWRVISKAKVLVANSTYTYGQLSGSTKKKTVVIPNFYPEEMEKVKLAGITKGNYIIASSNGFTKRKNIHRAIQAFAQVRPQFPNTELYLIGTDMEENGPAQQYAESKGLAKGIRFLGKQPYNKVLELVAGAKVLVCPSMEESFGMAILEAMVVGTAVVAGDKSGYVPSLLDHGRAGVLCNIYSTDSIAQGIAKLLQDTTYREQLEDVAMDYAAKNFSEETVIKQHILLLEKIFNTPDLKVSEQILENASPATHAIKMQQEDDATLTNCKQRA